MVKRLTGGIAVVSYAVLVLVALVPIGANTNVVDGRQQVDWWTSGSLLAGVVTTGDPIKLTWGSWAAIAAAVAILGVVGTWTLWRHFGLKIDRS